MFDIGIGELTVILTVALLLFGPKRLPEIGKALGGSLKAFKEGLKEGQSSDSAKEQEKASKGG